MMIFLLFGNYDVAYAAHSKWFWQLIKVNYQNWSAQSLPMALLVLKNTGISNNAMTRQGSQETAPSGCHTAIGAAHRHLQQCNDKARKSRKFKMALLVLKSAAHRELKHCNDKARNSRNCTLRLKIQPWRLFGFVCCFGLKTKNYEFQCNARR